MNRIEELKSQIEKLQLELQELLRDSFALVKIFGKRKAVVKKQMIGAGQCYQYDTKQCEYMKGVPYIDVVNDI